MIEVRFTQTCRVPTDRLGTGRVRIFTEGDLHKLPPDIAHHVVDQGLATFTEGTERKIVDAGEFAEGAIRERESDPLTVDDLPRAGSWYRLPNGEKVLGKDAAEEALAKLQR